MNLRLGLIACAMTLLFCSGCATAWARGVVRSESGQEVSGAKIEVAAAGAAVAAADGVSEFNGCFNVTAAAKRDQPEFVLTVAAPGYKTITFRFDRRQRLTALVALAPEGGPGEGSVTRVAESDELKAYEKPCLPEPVPGAYLLGIR